MSLRLRISLVAALAVVVAFGVGGVVAYQAAQRSLYQEVDASLRAAAVREARAALRPDAPGRGDDDLGAIRNDRFGSPGVYAQVIDADGAIVRASDEDAGLDPSRDALEVAAEGGTAYENGRAGRTPIRTLTVGLQPGLALQVSRSTREIEESLDRLRGLLLLAGGIGALLAIALGFAVADRGLVPLRRLAGDVEDAARARDLNRRLPERGGSESVRLAAAVNALLAGLEEARSAQDQLVADAAHELRTPLTALRTDVETLASQDLPPAEAQQIAAALDREITEIGRMITGIVDLARGARPVEQSEALRLDDIAADVVARAVARRPGARIELDAEPTPMTGDPLRLERALGNLVENALLHGAEPVTVRVRPGCVTVDDAGAGVPADQREAMFERFRRGPASQNRPGSGLGLAIVRQDVAAHGGAVVIGEAPTGGCRVTITLPA